MTPEGKLFLDALRGALSTAITTRHASTEEVVGWLAALYDELNLNTPAVQKIRQKHADLEADGFVVGPRDPDRGAQFPGRWMVAQPLDEGEDAATSSAFCIVGDNLPALIVEAHDTFITNKDADQ